MKGRYWVGFLAALALLMLGGCANTVFPFLGGLAGLVGAVIGGAIVGYAVPRTDEAVKENPGSATSASALAGLIAGVGAAAGFVLSGLIVGAMLSSLDMTALGPDFERMLEEMARQYETAGFAIDADSLLYLSSVVLVGGGLCLGITAIGLTTGAAALTARLSAPTTPAPGYGAPVESSLPAWGEPTPAPPPEPPPASPEAPPESTGPDEGQ